ncbi:MAG: hypothetical protein AVDCRST_MAG78-2050 [uncultured Rubrobacteraceae bacterium]|uniref:Uncharacterized protein n=1 Tax=uncultured Rubrobacteraceae bacterium TaxID=349277 RepID=A0A6J4QFL4_9ACTN|nr:MAG: hypothetical protein AVDCRST_MAG78-2050 [uncultured Rubrobacteraceae bacterium]
MQTLGEAGERPAEDRVGRVLLGLGAKIREGAPQAIWRSPTRSTSCS